MAKIKAITGGLLTTVQDKGRIGYQKYGIPQSGVMDERSFAFANLLVGNPWDEAALEITYMGPQLQFSEDTIIAVTGAECELFIDQKPIAMNESHQVPAGSILRFGRMLSGVRAYLAFGGTIDVPILSGSKSTFLKGKMGGFQGRALKPHDEFSVENLRPFKKKVLAAEFRPVWKQDVTLRVLPGPQYDAFTEEGLQTFVGEEGYTVTPYADRMGYRLDGPAIAFQTGADIISDGMVMGSVQVPAEGKPIVLMADRQTTGGYTKIATVLTPDLRKLAQTAPKAKIHFTFVSLAEAEAIYREDQASLRRAQSYLDY